MSSLALRTMCCTLFALGRLPADGAGVRQRRTERRAKRAICLPAECWIASEIWRQLKERLALKVTV